MIYKGVSQQNNFESFFFLHDGLLPFLHYLAVFALFSLLVLLFIEHLLNSGFILWYQSTNEAIIRLLQNTDKSLVGGWFKHSPQEETDVRFFRKDDSTVAAAVAEVAKPLLRLENFQVPPLSLARTVTGGSCEIAQQHLSDLLGTNQQFLLLYDSLLMDFLLPQLKQRISQENKTSGKLQEEKSTYIFHYQRPPTLRLQPGPSNSFVKLHADSEYGHQDGELNYWLPLTDPNITKTELWCESKPGAGDYHPVHCHYGDIHIFFGSFCRHYVPPNPTHYTRISLDFRIGVEGLGFDPSWQMLGTKDDHSRQKVTL